MPVAWVLASEKLPPTPTKFHYIFNLRDLGRVYEGVCLATPALFASGASIVRIWRNESLRILGDRLINEQDVGVVNGIVATPFGGVNPTLANMYYNLHRLAYTGCGAALKSAARGVMEGLWLSLSAMSV